MTLTQLRYIIAVDRHGGFAPAARHCLVTPPTLSLQIQKLEQEIGAEIFDRRKTPVVATHYGRRVIDQAQRVMREAEKIDELFRDDEEPSGEITLGMIPTVAPILMPALFRTLGERYGRLQFRIFELPTTQIVEKMRAGEIELGILATPLGYKDLGETPLYYENFVAYFPQDYTGPYSDLDPGEERPGGYDMILLGEDHCFRSQSLRVCGNRNESRIECGSLETLMQMVDRGAGMTLLPEMAARTPATGDAGLAAESAGKSAAKTGPKGKAKAASKKKKKAAGSAISATASIAPHLRGHIASFRAPQPVREISLVHPRDFYKKKIFDAIKEIVIAQIPEELRERGGRQLIDVEV